MGAGSQGIEGDKAAYQLARLGSEGLARSNSAKIVQKTIRD
jgi:hypothetical protein